MSMVLKIRRIGQTHDSVAGILGRGSPGEAAEHLEDAVQETLVTARSG